MQFVMRTWGDCGKGHIDAIASPWQHSSAALYTRLKLTERREIRLECEWRS